MRKVVVLPHEVYESMQKDPHPQALLDPKKQKLVSVENELQTILNNPNIEIHEKKALYQHWLQKLVDDLSLYKNNSLPQPETPDTQDANTANSPKDRVIAMLENALPPSVRAQGMALYNAFLSHPTIEWDNQTGEFTIDGYTVIGSNIVDICGDLARRWRRPAPTGWNRIKTNIGRGGFPHSLIINPMRLAELIKATPVRLPATPDTKTPTLQTIPSRRTLFKTYPIKRSPRTNIHIPQAAHTQITALQNFFNTSLPTAPEMGGTPVAPKLSKAQLNVLRQIISGGIPPPPRPVTPSAIPRPTSSRSVPRSDKQDSYPDKHIIKNWMSYR